MFPESTGRTSAPGETEKFGTRNIVGIWRTFWHDDRRLGDLTFSATTGVGDLDDLDTATGSLFERLLRRGRTNWRHRAHPVAKSGIALITITSGVNSCIDISWNVKWHGYKYMRFVFFL